MKNTIRNQYIIRLRRMQKSGFSSYKEYLRSKEWAAIRKRVRSHPSPLWKQCRVCGSHENLNIHHNSYKSLGKGPKLDSLVILCRSCHKWVHRYSIQHPSIGLRRSYKRVQQLFPKLLSEKTPLIDSLLVENSKPKPIRIYKHSLKQGYIQE